MQAVPTTTTQTIQASEATQTIPTQAEKASTLIQQIASEQRNLWQRVQAYLHKWRREGSEDESNDEFAGELTLRRLAPTPLYFGYDGTETFLTGMIEEAVTYADEMAARHQ